ncbi:hypothetical protein [Paenibacillus sp. OV219]|uniref:hypothetical protein n=1 Tax=Paenibacillus sp. OV219 TaxID=1884377 RepID=UPI0008D41C4A|nr:hypothetical protein [Paenibacillus sp. OV219]SEM92485.1 NQR2, RnfD, RnfE family [Paenibacillus sp. OV219]
MTLEQWLKTPKGYVVIALTSYMLIVIALSQDMKGIVNGILAVIVTAAVDTICCLLEKRKRILPDGAVITGLIIAMILGTHTSHLVVAARRFHPSIFSSTRRNRC